MKPDFDKDEFPIWCEGHHQQGYIFVDNPEGFYFVICDTCGWETSDVWCSKCGMGGGFVKNIEKRPSTWSCPNCKTRYELPDGFYENPVPLLIEVALPQSVRDRLKAEEQSRKLESQKNIWKNLFLFIALMIWSVIFIALMMLPIALVLTPLPWSLPGFIVTLMIFPAWWWLSLKLIKNIRIKFSKQT